ncbi:UNVERIFIED_ORG: regulator of RNase E activity RraA [Arthrobacter sp. UYCu721]
MTKTREHTSQFRAAAAEFTDEHLQQLLKADTATVYEAQSQHRSIASEIQPLDPAMKFAGTAVTALATLHEDLMLHHAVPSIQQRYGW